MFIRRDFTRRCGVPNVARPLSVLVLSLFLQPAAYSQDERQPITIDFDNTGDETGVTPPGTTMFSFAGSTWEGGEVSTAGITALYASGAYSYHIEAGGGSVTFDEPVSEVAFFYVHGFGFAEGTATAFDMDETQVGSAASNQATTFGDSENFVSFEAPQAGIQRLEFSGGIIDAFTYLSPSPLPPPIEPSDLTVTLRPVASGLSSPVFLTHAGDASDRLFVVDQVGLIHVIEDGIVLEEPFLDLSASIVTLNENFDERGLLGLAFHPDFETNGRFFIRYSAPREAAGDEPCADSQRGCHKEVLSEFVVSGEDPNVADPRSERVLFEVDEPEFNHNAGHVAFGPDDLLYFSLGDGGGRDDGLSSMPPAHGPGGNGQNPQTPLGALLRIDVDGDVPYSVPPDNPFTDDQENNDLIYAYGFRNPYRFSFDRGGDRELFLADVGQDLIEEVNVVMNGGNYGWVIKEGSTCFNVEEPMMPLPSCDDEGLIDPVAEYDHDDGIAVVGGFIYRGERLPALAGKYVFGDFSQGGADGRLFWLDADGNRSEIFELQLRRGELGRFLLGFGEDEDGELYVLTSQESGPLGTAGEVFQIVSGDAGFQVPGDCNQDGSLDVSDPSCLFEILFLGSERTLPCGDGTLNAPANVGFMDFQPDGTVDISDGVSLLNFLFLGGPPHPLVLDRSEPMECVAISGCPVSSICP